MNDSVYSVSELTQALQELLEETVPLLWVEGEVSNFRASQAGHWYFTLKDSAAQLPCVLFRRLAVGYEKLRPRDGEQVRLFGQVTIYPRGGVYQMIVQRLVPVGRGDLYVALEQLRARLEAEGLFDSSRKRPLPRFPRHIGVITSPTGAAIRDILRILARRYPLVRVTLYPALVQGVEAPPTIIRALKVANRLAEADVLIVGRGGGSVEDLWAFNDEGVVRTIATSQIPVVSAVGHEIDWTLSDLAADVRAPTPSAAAELVVPDRAELLEQLRHHRERLERSLLRRLQRAQERLDYLRRSLSPRRQRELLYRRMQYLDDLDRRLTQAVQSRLQTSRADLKRLAGTLHALSPLATLERGYSICTDASGKVIRDVREVSVGERVAVRLRRGSLRARVEERIPQEAPAP